MHVSLRRSLLVLVATGMVAAGCDGDTSYRDPDAGRNVDAGVEYPPLSDVDEDGSYRPYTVALVDVGVGDEPVGPVVFSIGGEEAAFVAVTDGLAGFMVPEVPEGEYTVTVGGLSAATIYIEAPLSDADARTRTDLLLSEARSGLEAMEADAGFPEGQAAAASALAELDTFETGLAGLSVDERRIAEQILGQFNDGQQQLSLNKIAGFDECRDAFLEFGIEKTRSLWVMGIFVAAGGLLGSSYGPLGALIGGIIGGVAVLWRLGKLEPYIDNFIDKCLTRTVDLDAGNLRLARPTADLTNKGGGGTAGNFVQSEAQTFDFNVDRVLVNEEIGNQLTLAKALLAQLPSVSATLEAGFQAIPTVSFVDSDPDAALVQIQNIVPASLMGTVSDAGGGDISLSFTATPEPAQGMPVAFSFELVYGDEGEPCGYDGSLTAPMNCDASGDGREDTFCDLSTDGCVTGVGCVPFNCDADGDGANEISCDLTTELCVGGAGCRGFNCDRNVDGTPDMYCDVSTSTCVMEGNEYDGFQRYCRGGAGRIECLGEGKRYMQVLDAVSGEYVNIRAVRISCSADQKCGDFILGADRGVLVCIAEDAVICRATPTYHASCAADEHCHPCYSTTEPNISECTPGDFTVCSEGTTTWTCQPGWTCGSSGGGATCTGPAGQLGFGDTGCSGPTYFNPSYL